MVTYVEIEKWRCLMISMISCDIHRRRRGSLSEEEYETTFIGIREATVTGSGDCYAWDRQLALCKRRRDAHRGVVPGLSDSAGVCLESGLASLAPDIPAEGRETADAMGHGAPDGAALPGPARGGNDFC